MRKVNYSFIIPHKNSFKLLDRCLKSIPRRDDLEIIVVDDHSCDFEDVEKMVAMFPYVRLFINEGLGAGGARNTGLSKARGKWLLFADCDDYYVDGFLNELDKYIDLEADVIYFNFFQFIEGKDEPIYEKVSNYITECAAGKLSVDYVKYRNNTPWNKMVKRDFVEHYHIRFEEQPIGNDVFFSYQIGYWSQVYKVIDVKLYNYIVYNRSQTNRNWNKTKVKTFLENISKYNGFVTFVNHKEWTHGFPFICFQLYKAGDLRRTINVLKYYFSHYGEIKRIRSKYVDLLSQNGNKIKN